MSSRTCSPLGKMSVVACALVTLAAHIASTQISPPPIEPPPGGGGGSPTIGPVVSLSADNVNITYTLDRDYPGGLNGDVTMEIFREGISINRQVVDGTAGPHQVSTDLGNFRGTFDIRITLDVHPDPLLGDWESGIGCGFYLSPAGAITLFLPSAWIGQDGVPAIPLDPKCPPSAAAPVRCAARRSPLVRCRWPKAPAPKRGR